MDSYQIPISVTRASSTTPNGPFNFTFGGSKVYASKNVMYTNVLPLVNSIELPNTTILASYRSTSGTSIDTSSYSNPGNSSTPAQPSYVSESGSRDVLLNENNEFQTPRLITSAVNQENQMQGNTSSNLYLELSSSRSNLSPIIDTQRVSLVTTTNRVGNFDGVVNKEYFFNEDASYTDGIGIEAVEDFNPANYVTKLVTLENACTGLRVEFGAFNPSSTCNLDVYVKALSGEESDPLEVNWSNLTTSNYSDLQDELFFRDYKFEFDITDGGNVPNATFTQFQVKIRMRSSNQAVVPMLKDLRCIALA